MNTVLQKLIRKDLASAGAYAPVPAPRPGVSGLLKLDANENQYGLPKAVRKVLGGSINPALYPDPDYRELRTALSRYANVPPDMIVVGSGADELLDLIIRLITEPGDGIVNCPPTFGMYRILIKLNRGTEIRIPRTENDTINTEGVVTALKNGAKAAIICTPNNPTGTVLEPSELERMLSTGKVVLLDEAYIEFGGEPATRLISRFPNLIIIRTFSKWAGLAGLRLGYALMSPDIARALDSIRPPYNVNSMAVAAGCAVLENIPGYGVSLRMIRKERARMLSTLMKLPMFRANPSNGNFLFLRCRSDIGEIREYLTTKGIAVRYYDDTCTGPAIRITIGTPKQNRKVMSTLAAFRPEKIRTDAVIFDIDGVLVDVRNSYRTAIQKTVGYVIRTEFPSGRLPQTEDIDAIKSMCGFNNDWDASYVLVRLLAKRIPSERFGDKARRVTGKTRQNRLYARIKDIFQTYYLGAKGFAKTYGRPAPITSEPGLILSETALIRKTTLGTLKNRFVIGAATSRPRAEAMYALKSLGIMPMYISPGMLIAQEDAPREKPFPDPLLAAQEKLGAKDPVYVGDSISDVAAARAAGFPCISVGTADFGVTRISDVNTLPEVLI